MTTRVTADAHGHTEAQSLGGGTLRARHGADPNRSTSNLVPEGQGPRVQTHDRGRRTVVTVSEGRYIDEVVSNHHQISAADFRAERGPGILASARSPFGIPVTADRMTPDTIVDTPTGETRLAVAERMGYVTRDRNGNYMEAHDGSEQQDQEKDPEQDAQQDSQPVPFSEATENEYRALVEAVPEGLQMSLLTTVMAGGLEGSALNDLAANSGMSPEELSGRVDAAAEAFQAQADAVLQEAGFDPDDVYDFLRTQAPGKMHEMIIRFVVTRDPSVWQGAARMFRANVAPKAEDVERAGYQVRRTADGTELVVINGSEFTLLQARQFGLI